MTAIHHAEPRATYDEAPKRVRTKGIVLVAIAASALVATGLIWRAYATNGPRDALSLTNNAATSSLPDLPTSESSSSRRVSGESANVIGMTESDRLRLNPLAQAPEDFAHSSNNPFACGVPVGGQPRCDWDSDSMVARSPAEAAWMAERGYPTLEQRKWASSQSSAEVLAEAERTGSAALWALGLERLATESSDAGLAADAALNLERLASTSKSLYALERSASLQAHVIELTLAEQGWSEGSKEAGATITSALEAARNAGLQAALLGDGLAMMRIEQSLGAVPGIRDTTYWKKFENRRFWELGSDIKHLQLSMQRNAHDQKVGLAGPHGGFVLSDIKPRPVQTNVTGDGRPGGVWVEY